MKRTKSPLIARARQLRRNTTDAERRLWYHLRDRRLDGQKFRRQFPVGRYVTDFACPVARLVVELDGGQHAEALQADRARTAFLESAGYRVIRFWNDEVLVHTETVLQMIREALAEELGRPSP